MQSRKGTRNYFSDKRISLKICHNRPQNHLKDLSKAMIFIHLRKYLISHTQKVTKSIDRKRERELIVFEKKTNNLIWLFKLLVRFRSRQESTWSDEVHGWKILAHNKIKASSENLEEFPKILHRWSTLRKRSQTSLRDKSHWTEQKVICWNHPNADDIPSVKDEKAN